MDHLTAGAAADLCSQLKMIKREQRSYGLELHASQLTVAKELEIEEMRLAVLEEGFMQPRW